MALNESELTRVRGAVTKLLTTKKKVADLIDQLDRATKELHEQEFTDLPDLLHELGVEGLMLDEGISLKLANFYKASIPNNNPALRAKAFEWLRANGHEALIKRELTQTFAVGHDEDAQKVIKQLNKLGIPFSDKESVHGNTLTAFVKEQHRKGNVTLPLEAFGAFIGERVVIKEIEDAN